MLLVHSKRHLLLTHAIFVIEPWLLVYFPEDDTISLVAGKVVVSPEQREWKKGCKCQVKERKNLYDGIIAALGTVDFSCVAIFRIPVSVHRKFHFSVFQKETWRVSREETSMELHI